MKIDITTLKKTKGIGDKTLQRIITQHEQDNNVKEFQSLYIVDKQYQIHKPISLWQGDSTKLLSHIPDNTIDMMLCDPPYFLDKMGEDWSDMDDKIQNMTSKTITNLPSGMKFDSSNNAFLHDLIYKTGIHYMRIMKEGSLGIMFTQARLTHCVSGALEEAGLEIRDLLFWERKTKPKAQNLNRYGIKDNVVTPQPLQMMEVMVLFRKPAESFVKAYNDSGVGMMNYNRSSVYSYSQPTGIDHPTPKPIELIEELLNQFTTPDMLVLDNFMGSGSTGVACRNTHRRFIGIELDGEYFDIAKKRINV